MIFDYWYKYFIREILQVVIVVSTWLVSTRRRSRCWIRLLDQIKSLVEVRVRGSALEFQRVQRWSGSVSDLGYSGAA